MTKRIAALIAVTSIIFGVNFTHAQQPEKILRIGYLRVVSCDPGGPSVTAFRRGLRELGYIEGKNLLIEYRCAEGKPDRVPSLVNELVKLKVDVLISGDAPAIRAAKQATKTIPIVMVINQDPVESGIINSLARPGGNVTGISRLTRELSGKRLELIREAVPGKAPIAILWDADGPGPKISFTEYQAVARALKIPLQSLEVRGPDPDLDGAFRAAKKGRASAVIIIGNSLLNRYRKRIADLAIKHRLPSMYESSQWVEIGGLISYSTNDAESYRRAAYYVDRIHKGTKPADLPVEQPMKFEFVINLKTAKQIGVTIPQWTLMKADRVIR
jgi:putative ABC transport system substrate-binding protein